MQSGSLEERRDNIHYVPESFPCEDSFSLEYQKSECEPFILSNDESYRITNNDQMSRSSASPTTCGGDGSFEESTLHSFFSNPNNPLDPLPADNSLSSFSSVGWKRCRSDHLFDYASSSSQNMVRRRSASAVLGGSRREDEFLLEPTRRFSLREDEIMRERLLHTESLSREDCIPSSHRSDTIVEWDPRKSGYDIQNTLSGLFQRMDQLEQENSLLRNNLNQLVARIPDPSMKEQLY